jgi:hypothetical protein
MILDPDGAAELYYAGVKTFETTAGGAKVTSSLEVGDNLFVVGGQFFMGTDDVTTDNSWRFLISGDDLLIQQRESGTWNTKSTISGA